MLASTSQQTHSRDVDSVGSRSARSTGWVGVLTRGPRAGRGGCG